MAATRRLAAIFAADVAGYSRLMGLDEAGTAQPVREHRVAADPLIAEYGGPAEALAEYETVIASDRNHGNALAATSWCLAYTGSLEPAMAVLLQVIRPSPRDPEIGVWFGRIGLIHPAPKVQHPPICAYLDAGSSWRSL
jgi:class 3 adenylate cyclase